MAGQEVASAEDFVSVRLIWSSAAHTHTALAHRVCAHRDGQHTAASCARPSMFSHVHKGDPPP